MVFIVYFGPKNNPIDRWDLPPKIHGFHCLIWKRKTIWCPAVIDNCAQIQCFHILFFRPWVPKTVPKPSRHCPGMVIIVLFQNAIQSDAQLLLIIVRRSDVFIYYFFAPGPPKPSRNRPETARVQNRYFSKGFQLKIDGFSIPGRSRPDPALKIDTFLKDFN